MGTMQITLTSAMAYPVINSSINTSSIIFYGIVLSILYSSQVILFYIGNGYKILRKCNIPFMVLYTEAVITISLSVLILMGVPIFGAFWFLLGIVKGLLLTFWGIYAMKPDLNKRQYLEKESPIRLIIFALCLIVFTISAVEIKIFVGI